MPCCYIMVYRTVNNERSDIFAYMRTLDSQKLIVVCNFTEQEKDFALPEIFEGAERVIGNYEETAAFNLLRPYEAYALSITK